MVNTGCKKDKDEEAGPTWVFTCILNGHTWSGTPIITELVGTYIEINAVYNDTAIQFLGHFGKVGDFSVSGIHAAVNTGVSNPFSAISHVSKDGGVLKVTRYEESADGEFTFTTTDGIEITNGRFKNVPITDY